MASHKSDARGRRGIQHAAQITKALFGIVAIYFAHDVSFAAHEVDGIIQADTHRADPPMQARLAEHVGSLRNEVNLLQIAAGGAGKELAG